MKFAHQLRTTVCVCRILHEEADEEFWNEHFASDVVQICFVDMALYLLRENFSKTELCVAPSWLLTVFHLQRNSFILINLLQNIFLHSLI